MSQPKYELNTTKRVDRKIQKIVKKDKKLDKRLRKVFKQLKKDPFYKGLKTHKVNTPKWNIAYSSRVTGDIRLIWYLYERKLLIVVVDVGGHEGSKAVY
jgi:mRNA-degrading endonuclease YafQ of YafQ-DinJ toxin-antitoxin module